MTEHRIPLTIYKREAFLIDTRHLEEDDIATAKEMYTYSFYDEKVCKGCDLLPDRHTETCDSCAAFKGKVCLAKTIEEGSFVMLSLPIGNKKLMSRFLTRIGRKDDYVVVSKHRPPTEFRRPITFTGKLRPYQDEAVTECLARRMGVIKSPPRSGKTVIGAALACEIGAKTLILAHQREWLVNFQETFLGSDTQPRLTDARKSQVRFCKTVEDFGKTDVCLATPQQFMSKGGQKTLELIRHMFTLVIFDEVHQAAATETARVLARVNTKYRIGLSGTPDRKDQRYVIAENLVGRVLYDAKVERLRPRVQLLYTGLPFSMDRRNPHAFTYFVNRMESHKERREKIVKKALELARNDHLVMIPLSRVASIKAYTKYINEEAEEDWARAFYGGVKGRKELIEDARNYKFRIIVGNISLLSTGINIPRASAIIDRVTPSSNIPKATQRLSRILTPWEGKPEPLIVLVLDESDAGRNMLRNEFWNCIHPVFNPLMDKTTYNNLMSYLADRDRIGVPSLKDVFG